MCCTRSDECSKYEGRVHDMDSYFIRHTKELKVKSTDVDRLWRENKVAIHFPGKGEKDSTSINPDDYKGDPAAQMAMKVYKELNDNGGYIWAQYYTHKHQVKIGKIKPKNPKLFPATWEKHENPKRQEGDPAVLKSLQIVDVRTIDLTKSNYWGFVAGQPRRGTLRKWREIDTRLEELVENGRLRECWKNLWYAEQETVCSEFLRSGELKECPKLKFLLLPVGGTLEDIDISGYSEDDKMILAQVTNYEYSHPTCRKKIQKLEEFNNESHHLVFFCNCPPNEKKRILFVSNDRVFEWLKKNKGYFERLFPDGSVNSNRVL